MKSSCNRDAEQNKGRQQCAHYQLHFKVKGGKMETILGPVEINIISPTDGGVQGCVTRKTHENAWQYAKVYHSHVDANGDPTEEYWKWAIKGWDNRKAVRYPMGKGKAPVIRCGMVKS